MSGQQMTIGDFAAMLGENVAVKGAGGVKFSSVEIDSRKVKAGSLFFAIEGERDGHDFIQDAADNGAAAAVVSHYVGVSIPQILVTDTRKALLDSARLWREKFSLPIVAVAGSNGKTTTTQMILSIMSSRFDAGHWIGTQGNLNNDMGVALMVWRLRDTHEIAAFEVGMNHIGEMAPLVGAVKPSIGVVTNTMRDHQEFLASLEETARENGEVYVQLPKTGVAVINEADPFADLWKQQAEGRRIVTYGLDTSDVYGMPCGIGKFKLITPVGETYIELQVPGQHNITNAVCAAAVSYAMGRDLSDIKKGLEKFQAVLHRGQLIRLSNGSILIDDSYNSNPDSMIAAIKMLKDFDLPKICALGDMGELGVTSVDCHKEIGAFAKECGIDEFICCGNRMMDAAESFGQTAQHCEQRSEMVDRIVEKLKERPHVVLIKASNFMRLFEAVKEIKEKTENQ